MQPLQRSYSQDGCLPTPPHLLGVQPEVLLAYVPGTLGKSFLVATPRVAQLGGGGEGGLQHLPWRVKFQLGVCIL